VNEDDDIQGSLTFGLVFIGIVLWAVVILLGGCTTDEAIRREHIEYGPRTIECSAWRC
jgi:hypothetical protein